MARPTKYKEEYNKQAYRLCLLGATDASLADFFEVDERTINNWKIDFPMFFQSIKDGRVDADAKVAESLYKRATGYTYKEEVATKQGIVKLEKVLHPDTAAAFIWLKNRQPKNWRDKHEVEHSGAIDIKSKAKEIDEYLYGSE